MLLRKQAILTLWVYLLCSSFAQGALGNSPAPTFEARHWQKTFYAFKSKFLLKIDNSLPNQFKLDLSIELTKQKHLSPGSIWKYQFTSMLEPRIYMIENELVAGGFFGWIKTESDLDFHQFFFLTPAGKVLTFPAPPQIVFSDTLLTYSKNPKQTQLTITLLHALTGKVLWTQTRSGNFSEIEFRSNWQRNPDCFDLEPTTPNYFSRLVTEEKKVLMKKVIEVSKQDLSFCLEANKSIIKREKLEAAKGFPLKEEQRLPANSPNFLVVGP